MVILVSLVVLTCSYHSIKQQHHCEGKAGCRQAISDCYGWDDLQATHKQEVSVCKARELLQKKDLKTKADQLRYLPIG